MCSDIRLHWGQLLLITARPAGLIWEMWGQILQGQANSGLSNAVGYLGVVLQPCPIVPTDKEE